jgi:hypothetical protein
MADALAGASSPVKAEPAPNRRSGRRRGRPSRARGQPNSSDEAVARWTVRGVPPTVRDMAVRAAAARGMTVGDWVAEAIVALARDKRTAAGPNLPTVEAPPDLSQVLRSLEERLTRIEQRQQTGLFARLFGRRF